jgi:hypothetical protein
MIAIAIISFECGEVTCASSPGEFCKYFGTTGMGQNAVCRLFPPKDDSHTVLNEAVGGMFSGWTLRCADCIAHASRDE